MRPSTYSDGVMRERTGSGWAAWFALLDGWNATARSHTEIARWLVTEHEVPGCWAQTGGYWQERLEMLKRLLES